MNIPGYVWIVVATGLIGSVGCATSHRAEAPVGGTAFVRHDTSGSGNSGVRYYLAPSPQGPRPLLVLIQGSGCEPLFIGDGDHPRATAGQDLVYSLAKGRFAVMVVEKPGVETAPRSDGTAESCGEEFRRRHSLDAWAGVVAEAIDAARRDPGVIRGAPVRVMGLSEGAITAARVARDRPDVSHIAFISGFGCDQWGDMLVVARRNAEEEAKAKPPAERAAAVAATEAGLRAVAADPTNPNLFFEGQTYLFWSTFGRACPATDLARAKADVFVAYGTADEQVDPNGVEAIIAARIGAGKPVTAERVIGGSHVLNTPDSGPFANLVAAFGQALDWMDARP